MENESRRNFLRQFGTAVGFTVSLPVVSSLFVSCEQDEGGLVNPIEEDFIEIILNENPELQEVGGAVQKIIEGFNQSRALNITRISQTEFLVASSSCPHAGCVVPIPENGDLNSPLTCPCHGAQYDALDGSVVRQPNSGSTTNLKKFEYEFDQAEGILKINKEESAVA